MGGCQSATDDTVKEPKKIELGAGSKFKKLQKHVFDLPTLLYAKLELVSSSVGKVTDYITLNPVWPVRDEYMELDVGNNLDEDNKYFDKLFGNSLESLSDKPVPQKVEWKRPQKFIKGGYSVFQGSIQPNDIKQGKLGDCYLLSSMAAISQYPFVVKRIFSTTQVSSYGAYGVWLFIDGIWKCVVVDDRFPIHNNRPLYSRNHQNQLWVMLIEKAYAKVYGSYQRIQSGLTGIGMNCLTGAPFEYLCKDSSNKINPEAAWEFINTHTALNHLLTGSTENNDRNGHLGLVSTHAYTILDCKQVYISTKKGKKLQRILKLNNPWGRYEWKGNWSDSSQIWTPELKQQLKLENKDDGTFWINVEDFLDNFGQICVCKYNKNFVNTSLPLKFSETENDYRCAFLSILNRTEGYLNLYQKDHRFFPDTDYKYSLVRLIIMKIDKVKKTLSKYINDTMDCDRDASIYVELDPGDYYIVVQVDWNAFFTREATLNFYGQHPVTLIQDKNPPSIQQLFNEIVLLHQEFTEKQRVYQYEKDSFIKRVTGSLAGYVYYHYSNKSKTNNYLCESVVLKDKQFIQVHAEENPDEFIVKVYPQEERIVRLKVQKQGNSFYSFSTKIQFYIVQKFSLQKLRELTDKKPTKIRKREIESKEIDVIVKTYNYTGGIAILYQNKMDKYAYVEEVAFDIQNLDLQNEELPRNKKLQIQLEPQSEKLLSFIVSSPGKEVVFKTKVSFYLNSPQFKF